VKSPIVLHMLLDGELINLHYIFIFANALH